jgi:alpha-N-arabinofuranosidase
MTSLTLLAALAFQAPPLVAEYRLEDKVVAPMDRRMFGHFIERPSWGGEIGIEAAVDPSTGKLREDVIRRLKELQIPILRFPSGTDNDYVDWTDMITNAPGRPSPKRPVTTGHTGGKVTNRFGYDEFLALAQELKSDVILPVRFRDALLGLKPVDAEARHAAALAAYVNGRVGAQLPDGLDEYVKARIQNGRRDPWGVPIFQIGNETWFFFDELRKRYPQDPWGRYVEVLGKFVDAIHAVDPRIKIIADGVEPDLSVLIRQKLGDKIAFLADHYYAPWEMSTFQLDGKPYPVEKLTPKEVWQGWVSVFPVEPTTGQARMTLNVLRDKPRHRYPVAITEWNFNGWWTSESWRKGALDSSLARGVGAAGMLHALMRRSEDIRIATQSMTVGRAWGITAIHVWDDPKKPAQIYPTGLVVGLYAKHHGSQRLKLDGVKVPTYRLPYQVNGIGPYDKVQTTDVVATGDSLKVYMHAINSSFYEIVRLKFDVGSLLLKGDGWQYSMTGRLKDEGDTDIATVGQMPVRVEKGTLTVTLPSKSVSVIELQR